MRIEAKLAYRASASYTIAALQTAIDELRDAQDKHPELQLHLIQRIDELGRHLNTINQDLEEYHDR